MLSVLIAFGIFLTVVLVIEGSYYAYFSYSRRGRDLQRIKYRLQDWPTPNQQRPVTIVRKDVFSDIPWLDDLMKHQWNLGWLSRLHMQAAARTSIGTYLLMSAVCAGMGSLVPIFWHAQVLLVLGSGLVGASLPILSLYRLKKKRMDLFGRQLPDALDLMARALRAGHAFFVGMKLIGEECADPIGGEFKRAFDEISMGVSVPDALQNLAYRIDSPDLRFFVTAISVQRETGGNLAEIIELLAGMIRKRFQLYEKIRALSAEGRLSAYILFGLPFLVGTVLHVINPDYMDVLFTDPLGQKIVAVGLILMAIGALATKKMIAIKV